MKRILHLISQRPDSTGSGIYIQAMIDQANRAGYESFLVAGIQKDWAADVRSIQGGHSQYVRFNGADVSFQLPGMSDVMPYDSSVFSRLTLDQIDEYEAAFTRILTGAVTEYQPDVIHSHHLWLMSSLARCLFPDIPLITSCHGSDLRQFQNCPHLKDRVLRGCGRLDAVLALSEMQRETIFRLYGIEKARIHVTGTGYNQRIFNPEQKPPPTPVQIVYAGKLSRAKGVPWLLKVLSDIETVPWMLHLVGGGSGAEKDECLALARNIGDQVMVHGAVDQVTLAGIMKQSHIHVLPSFFEGLPLVILEALACGCRVVANNLPGVCELVRCLPEQCYSLVKTPTLKNIDQPVEEDLPMFQSGLKQALLTQIQRLDQPVGQSSVDFQTCLEQFSWNGVFKRVDQVITEVLSDNSAQRQF